MEYNLLISLGSAIIACCVGMLTGIFGIGGGFLMTPALMILLGIPAHVAVGTDLSMICFTSTFGIIKRWSSNTIDFKLGTIFASVSSVGVIAGICLLEKLKNMPPLRILGKEHIAVQYILLLVFVLLFIAVIMIFDFFSKQEKLKTHLGWFSKISFPPYIQIKSLYEPALPLIPVLILGLVIGY
jgi:uncharacterized membrane protein YfcA